jgi:hypothetical protein
MKMLCTITAFSLCLACKSNREAAESPVATASASSSEGRIGTPHDDLDRLDQRRGVPLLPIMAQHQKQNMREHLEAVRDVVAAAAVGDFQHVGTAARRMGFSEATGRMCEHMGAGAPGFTEQALAFHHAADEIATAAAKQDGPAVLSALSRTLGVCTGCHATYKQEPVATLPD